MTEADGVSEFMGNGVVIFNRVFDATVIRILVIARRNVQRVVMLVVRAEGSAGELGFAGFAFYGVNIKVHDFDGAMGVGGAVGDFDEQLTMDIRPYFAAAVLVVEERKIFGRNQPEAIIPQMALALEFGGELEPFFRLPIFNREIFFIEIGTTGLIIYRLEIDPQNDGQKMILRRVNVLPEMGVEFLAFESFL
jgi:hypothetical protein